MTWQTIEPWQPGPGFAHLQHDLANLLAPLSLASGMLEDDGPIAAVIASAVAEMTGRIDQVGWVMTRPVARRGTALDELPDVVSGRLPDGPLMGIGVDIDPPVLAAIVAPFGEASIGETTSPLRLMLAPTGAVKDALATSCPAAPYVVAKAHMDLTTLVAVVAGAGGTTEGCTDCGALRITLPTR